MDVKTASIKLSFEKTKADLVSVKLRVTFNRAQRRYAFPIKSGVIIPQKDFDRLLKYHEKGSERIGEEVKLLYGTLQPYLNKAFALAETLKPFSFDAFRDAFYSVAENSIPRDENNVLAALNTKGQSMRKEGRIGNAQNYELTAKSLGRFVNSFSEAERKEFMNIASPGKRKLDPIEAVLRFEHVTPEFLKVYEQWMLQKGKSAKSKKMSDVMPSHFITKKQIEKWGRKKEVARIKKSGEDGPASLTTVGIYARHLRSVFNDAISSKIVDRDLYPFGKSGYTIPAGTNIKKALPISDIQKLMQYECELGSRMQRSLDLWVFSYLGNGMNMADVCNLKWKDLDVQGSSLSFIRQKTARSRKGNQQNIRVHLFPESWSIIERWGRKSDRPMDFIFPFLDDSMDPERKKRVVAQVIKSTNQCMQKIADAVGITRGVGTYVARHSFVTILLKSGANLSFIKEKVGHATTRTTEIYAGSLEGAETQMFINALLPPVKNVEGWAENESVVNRE